jgi:hypothetical protein
MVTNFDILFQGFILYGGISVVGISQGVLAEQFVDQGSNLLIVDFGYVNSQQQNYQPITYVRFMGKHRQ